MSTTDDWKIFKGDNRIPHDGIEQLPEAPSWRPFGQDLSPGVSRRKRRGETFQSRPEEVEMINAALYLRRPLLITGKPGTGKSSLAYAVARELKLGEVLYWPITTRTTLKKGLYSYDAIGRLQEVKQAEGTAKVQGNEAQAIANYITLGPLGTAFLPSPRPRVLVIDEIDKSDIDLPNDLLTIFEEGRFEIPELVRLEPEVTDTEPRLLKVKVRTAYTDDEEPTGIEKKVSIQGGRIACQEFPLVIMTSNGERDFPPPFLRRCLRLTMREPNREELERIVQAHLYDCDLSQETVTRLIDTFLQRRDKSRDQLATDQLLNALFLITREREWVGDEREALVDRLLASLDRPLESKSSRTP
jgi:MoxR-like ATPase